MARLSVQASTATTLTLNGREVDAFGGCNYLGLAQHPEVIRALAEAAAKYGISTSASRETTGNTTVHDELERDLARFLRQDSSILVAEGYTANIAVAQTLRRDHGIALIDARAHRSIRAAATAAGMQVFEYEHLNADSAGWLARQYADAGVAIFTDGVFAADGAIAPATDLLRVLPDRRATLIIDDCHGFCVLGPRGRGTHEHVGLSDRRLVITTTLAKGLGCYGGIVAGNRALVDSVRERADVYRRSTPVPTPIAAAARAAIDLVNRDDTLIRALRTNTDLLRRTLRDAGITVHDSDVPVFTFTTGDAEAMRAMHEAILADGVYAPFIEYPGGPCPRFFRLTVSASHTPGQIERLGASFARHTVATA